MYRLNFCRRVAGKCMACRCVKNLKDEKLSLRKAEINIKLVTVVVLVIAIVIVGVFVYYNLSPFNKNIDKLLFDKNVSFQQMVEIEKKQVSKNPNNVDERAKLGDCYIMTNDFGKSEEQFQKILQIDPDNQYAKDMLKLIRFMRGEQ